jgi:hypothetical protein
VGWRRALPLAGAIAVLAAPGAQAATELSTSDRLQDRREIAGGTRANVLGFADGRFYANGWHIHGEMGGIWTTPMKMLDGVWFGVDGQWVGSATKFTSGRGYVRYDLPDSASGLQLSRTDFVPDGRRAALFGLELTNPSGADKTATVKVDAHSELMGAWPWGTDVNRGKPDASANLKDKGAYDGSSLVFTDDGSLGDGAPEHHYAAVVAADRTPESGQAAETDGGFWGPQPGNRCADNDATSKPSLCDDGPYGRGTGGELTYTVKVPAHGSETLWVAAAGSDEGLDAAKAELAGALRDPARAFAVKKAARAALARHSRVSLPGDPLLQEAVEWGKQNLADSTQTAENLHIRWTDQGKQQFPPPLGTVGSITWLGAGFPDYPWLFATDGEYTAFAAVALGQFEAAKAHLRALRDVSDVLSDRSGVVVHEVVPDGSVYFGHDSVRAGNGKNDFNTDEIVKFPSAVALVWRWTGDDRFRDEMYDFAKRNLIYTRDHLDADHDGWPEGSGNVEREGMGPEKLDVAVYYIRGLYDLADMAASKHDRATFRWASAEASRLARRFEATWWYDPAGQYADSLTATGGQLFQKYWIGETPMEAEVGGSGLARPDHGTTALAGRHTNEYSSDRPYNRGLFHTGRGGGSNDLIVFSLNTAIQAVGEGNYGRMGPDDQRRYTDANAETMISEPPAGGEPDEMPGAMPEILPSEGVGDRTDNDKNIDRCWGCRSMFMQAWGNYGTAWPVVHQQLGVSPDLGRDAVAVVPQVPDGQPRVEGSDIRLGRGSIDVVASHAGKAYTTRVNARELPAKWLALGAVLPAGSQPRGVRLDGRRLRHYLARTTDRGVEVTVRARSGGVHTLAVTAR